MQSAPLLYSFVTVDKRGVVAGREVGRTHQTVFAIGSGQMLAMLAIPGSPFLMGSVVGEGYADEQPQHKVMVRPFLLGRFPITQAQWAAVMADDKPCRFCGPHKAVHN